MSETFGEHLIPVSKSLRYYVSGPEVAENIHVVYLLHGYGQLAYYFLRKTAGLELPNVIFVAPEGTNRFYLNGTSGRVGASWMTKEMRATDIAENTAALDLLHAEILREYCPERISVIGFSQGGATAARWVGNGNVKADLFVSWASVFPPDVSFPQDLRGKQRNIFVLGTEDEFFSDENQQRAKEEYKKLGFALLTFQGKHDLHIPTLKQILE